ncbi:MAG: multicomponent Na+:H+ antiporter subunit [Clostridia bacterium]|nr:multicomponent Na+:H+ antiporter subunit [Clostridia bacterium]
MGKSETKETKKSINSGFTSSLFLTLALYIFWIVLSGKMEAKYLIIGFLSAVIITLLTRPLLLVSIGSSKGILRSVYDLPWLRLMAYFPWLMWQIVLANLQVAAVIINPKMPIQPQLITFRKKLPGPVAYLTLANSITLTPGTITVDLEGDKYLVHALIGDAAAQSLAPEVGEGEMPYRVSWVFSGWEKEH